jgi:tetratricopeptide (TPR) repeat protein
MLAFELLFLIWLFEAPAFGASQKDANDCLTHEPERVIPGCTRVLSDRNRRLPQHLRAVIYVRRGFAWRTKGDLNRAIVDYDEAIRLDPKVDNSHLNRGLAHSNKSELNAAVADFSEAIRLNPKSTMALLNRGAEYTKKGDFDRAIADLTETIRLDPENKDALVALEKARAANASPSAPQTTPSIVLAPTVPSVSAAPLEGPAKDSSSYGSQRSQADIPTPALAIPGWVDRLMRNPEDQELWAAELERQKGLYELLALRGRSRPRDPLLALATANNLQLQGIALRHLKRYDESLRMLSRSLDVLAALQGLQDCLSGRRSSVCDEIVRLRMMTWAYFANVYDDLQDSSNTERYRKLALSLAETEADYRNHLGNLTSFYLRSDDWEHAIQVVFEEITDAVAHKHKVKTHVAYSVAQSVYRQLAEGLSWERKTARRRSDDPRDFVDNWGLGIGRTFKYGMTNAHEDSATMVSLFHQQRQFGFDQQRGIVLTDSEKYLTGYSSDEEFRRNLDVEQYVRLQLADGHFEFAAKYLYYRDLNSAFIETEAGHLRCFAESASATSFDEVIERMETVPILTVSDYTRRAIQLLTLGAEFVRMNCQPG